MAYSGDFVAANRAARDAAINFFRKAKKPKHKPDLRRIYFRLWEWLAKRTPHCMARGEMRN
jgi:hypothetical protein